MEMMSFSPRELADVLRRRLDEKVATFIPPAGMKWVEEGEPEFTNMGTYCIGRVRIVAKPKAQSILKPWVCELGLRHQGVLIAGVRGCDTAPKNDPSKLLARNIREAILIPHCGDSAKAVSFIEKSDDAALRERMTAFAKNLDHYPHHYVMHVIHVVGIIAYNMPWDDPQQSLWNSFYLNLCKGLHMNAETKEQIDARLNKDESSFGEQQKVAI